LIVVLAGGVGESGKAGQGYEERVGYAVELYKKGYAPRMIFSSGYSYFYNETLLMKALAIELGVPKSDIILEGKAKNTYENVVFTDEILSKEKWNKRLYIFLLRLLFFLGVQVVMVQKLLELFLFV